MSTIKPIKPKNPLIWNTAATFAATWFEAALSSGLPPGKYVGLGDKPVKMFVKDHIEIFLPMTISILLDMLNANSNCTEHMKREIYDALMDPSNDAELMDMGRSKTKQQHEDLIQKAIKSFDKRKMNFGIHSAIPNKRNLKGTTALGG